MAFTLGVFVIDLGFYMPSPMPMGIFWPALIVAVPSLIIGGYEKYKLQWFSLGVLLSSILVISFNFSSWGAMSFMVSVMQIIPAFSAIVLFLFGWALFVPMKARNKAVK